jgi:methanogenic corrinoid protein MtbC1
MNGDSVQMDRVNELERTLLSLDRIGAKKVLSSAGNGQSPLATIEELVVPVLERIGQAWEVGKISLAQVYMSGRICEEMVDDMLPAGHPERTNRPPIAIVVLEDFHFLGKRIVYSALRASGFELLNYNRMDVDTVVKRVKIDGIKILLVSVLMLPSALRVKELRRVLDEEGCAVKLLVGGAPFRFDRQLWREVGADAMGCDAAEAIDLVKKFIEESQ